MYRRNSWLLALMGAILLFLALGYVLVKPQAPNYPPYLSFSPDVDGVKGIVQLLKENGRPVKEWRQSWRFLPQQEKQALLVIEPGGLQPGERKAIQEWVEQGNDLLLFQKVPEDWDDLRVREVDQRKPGETRIEQADLPEAAALTGYVDAAYRLREAPGVTALLRDELGILAARKKLGKGSISVFLTPEWLTNGQILSHSHFELLWPYLQKNWQAIWFDEYHHGIEQRPGLLAVYPEWLTTLVLQLALAALLWLWWKGKRFGPVYTLREWVVRRGDESLLAVAGWYEHRRLAREALLHQERYLRRLLQERWGLHPMASDREIAAMARAKWTAAEAERLLQLLQHLQAVKEARRYTPKQLLQDSARIDEMIARMEKE
ncbi:DUF4350 domain-containing protein [Brevibacillus sp. SYP-B805]|uniref:DUF4350 domain-containing protein n=1 Tax=Brevibacillus sp. SYP-B805 TaxID=1578199 RepID=UPI0013E9D5E8|nr:DUF4350 domain-containing protein [Brevibacillus sp. SYP-B805]NGQ93843.1 DUF4350 domain-containing protein [Brevibacillus sp. SYP-B805]